MKMTGERTIPAPQSRVWAALNDPEVLKQSIPGCMELVKHSPTELSAKVMAKVGPVKATFAGDVTLSDLNPPDSYVITGKGTGGVAGFAEGSAQVRLEDGGGQTRMLYDVDARVGGKLAQIGSRLIESTARRMADDFFDRFAEAVTRGEAQAQAVPGPAPSASEPPAEEAPGPGAVGVAKKAAARKTGSRTGAARKTAAKGTVASKPVVAKPGRRTPVASIDPPQTVAPAPVTQPSPPKAAEAAPAYTPRPEAPRQPAPQKSWMENNVWLLVGAGVAALLLIIILAAL
jgi:hypothetical protein